MKYLRAFAATALALLLSMGIIAATAAASASASEFQASGTGESQLSGKEGTISFEYETGKTMKLECEKMVGKGSVTALKSEAQDVSVTSEECSVSGDSVSNFTTELQLNANGTVTLLKEVKVETKKAGICTIAIPAQGPLSGATYSNVTGPEGNEAIEANLEAKEIAWSATGSLTSCKGTGSKVGTGKPASLSSFWKKLIWWIIKLILKWIFG